MPQIGDKLYTHPHGRPERVGDVEAVITGETRMSWLMGDSSYQRQKVSKATLSETVRDHLPRHWYTAEQLRDLVFIKKYRPAIVSNVSVEKDVAKLIKIADILGLKLEN